MTSNDALHPPEHIRVLLAEGRRRGQTFELSWRQALRTLPRGVNEESRDFWREWKEIIRWAKPHYEAAFHLMDPARDVYVVLPVAQEAVEQVL